MRNKHLSNALFFSNLGFNITCLTGEGKLFYNYYSKIYLESYEEETTRRDIRFKNPNHQFESRKKQTDEDIEKFNWESAHGLGAVLGFNNLAVIDIDNCNNHDLILQFLEKLNLPNDYEWVVKSGFGYHIYFLSDFYHTELLKTVFLPIINYNGIFSRIELIFEGHCVLPDSLHFSGVKYTFLNRTMPASLPLKLKTEKILSSLNDFCDFSKEPLFYERSLYYYSRASPIETFSISDPYYLVLDTETNGLPFDSSFNMNNENELPIVLRLSWKIFDENFMKIKEESYFLKPNQNVKINQTSLKNMGLTYEQFIMQAFSINDIFNSFRQDLVVSNIIIGHNLDFNINFIKSQIRKHSLSLVDEYQPDQFYELDLNSKKMFCTMRKAKKLVGINKNESLIYPTLTQLYQKLFVKKFSNPENSQNRIDAIALCAEKLLKSTNSLN